MPLPELDALPAAVRACLPAGATLRLPPQGELSTVFVASTAEKSVVVKSTHDPIGVAALTREARALRALARTDLCTPGLLTFAQERDEAWLVAEYIEGRTLWHALRDDPGSAARATWLEQLGAFLGRVHATPVPAELEDRAATPWLDAHHRRRAARAPIEPDAWVRRRRAESPSAPSVRCLVHGDFTLDNAIVDDAGLRGVIDWGAAGLGDPDYDIALCLLPAPGVELSAADTAAFLDGYRSADLPDPIRAHFEALYGHPVPPARAAADA
jgi:aminoglycoside phosphotransferase (APT) family kinase protein